MPTKNSSQPPSATPTAADLVRSFGLEPKAALAPVQVQRLRKPLPGYAGLLVDVADLLARDGAALNVTDTTPDDVKTMHDRQRRLAEAEAALGAAQQSVYHQRLQLDSDAMGVLQMLARRVQSRAEESPELPVRWKTLLDFLGTFRNGGRSPSTPPAPIATETKG